MFPIVVLLVFVTHGQPALKVVPSPPVPDIDTVRQFLNDDGNKRGMELELVKIGAPALPVLETIIRDPKSPAREVSLALTFMALIQGDRRRYLALALAKLADDNSDIRLSALLLLGEIGDDRDAAPVIALLSDEDGVVRNCAIKFLQKYGGVREVAALTIWLKSGNHRNDGDHVRKVKVCRDALAKRLQEGAKTPKK